MSLSQQDIRTLLDQFKAEDQLLIANYNQQSKYLLDNCYRESITLAILAGKKCGANLYSEKMDTTQHIGTSHFQTKLHDGKTNIDVGYPSERENATILDAGPKGLETIHTISREGNVGIAVNVDQVAFADKTKPQRKLSHSFSSEDLASLAKKKRQRKISHSYSSEEIRKIGEKESGGDAYDTHLGSLSCTPHAGVRNEGKRADNYGEASSMAGVRKGIMRRYFHDSKTNLSNHAINQRDTRNEEHSNVEFSRSAQNKNIQDTSQRDTQNKEDIPVKLSSSTHDKKRDLSNQVASHTNTRSMEDSIVDFNSSSIISPSTSRRTSALETPCGRETDKVGGRRRKVSFFCGQPLTGIESLFTTQENTEKDQIIEAHENEESRTHEEELRKNKFRTNHWPGRKMSRSSFVYHL